MSLKTILVTGAGGYIGSVTTSLLLEKGYKIIAVDSFAKGYKTPLTLLQNKYGKDKIVWHQKDLAIDDLGDLFNSRQIDLIMHFAAFCDVGESWEKPELYFKNNVVGTERLLEAAKKAKVDKVIFSSTCTVYGEAKYLPVDEKHPLGEESSPYGASKKMCEDIIRWYQKTGFINYIFLRYFNVTGATDNGEIGDSKNPSFHLVQNAVMGALGLAKFELNYAPVDTPDGSPVRDYLNVVDLANAHILAAKYILEKEESDIFNLGTGKGNSVLEIIGLIKEKTGVNFKLEMSKNRRKGETAKMVADYSKAKRILRWEPEHTLEQSIEALITWYKKHPKGWEN